MWKSPVPELLILHAIEQRLLRGQRRVDGVGRLKFDFHTGGAEKMLRFFRPWGNKDHEAAPAQTRPGRAAFRQSPRAQGFGGGRATTGTTELVLRLCATLSVYDLCRTHVVSVPGVGGFRTDSIMSQ